MSNNYELNINAVRAAFWMFVCTFITSTFSFLTTPIFTRLMPPDSYGIVSAYNAWQDIIGIVISLSLVTSINKAFFDFKQDIYRYISSMLVLLGLSTIAGSILVHFFFTFLKVNYPLELEILLYIRTFFNLAMSYYFAHQKLEFHYKKSVICTLIYISLNITMGLVGVMNFPDFMAEAKIIGSNVGTIVVGIGVVIFYLKSSHKNLVQTSYWKYALSFGLPMMIQLVGFKILSQSDKLMISFLCGDYFAGLYSVPFAIGSIMQTLWNCVGQGFQPWMFTKLSTNNIQDIKKITSILFLFVGLVTVSISATAPLIMQIMASVLT